MSKIFISYSHKDEPWMERVRSHLQVFSREPVAVWSDRELRTGDRWQDKIRKAIDGARIAILLVSSDSLTSQFIDGMEIPAILRRCSDGLRLIPVVVKQCDWQGVDWIQKFQMLPRDGTALEGRSDINDQLATLARDIREFLTNPWVPVTPDSDDWRPRAELEDYEARFSRRRVAVQPGTGDRLDITRRFLSELSDRAPAAAEVVRLCAIPRLFDGVLLGLLRDKPQDLDDNAQLLKTIVGYTFVLPRRGGGYEYESDVRDVLLDEWRAERNKAKFKAVNLQIAHMYWRTYEQWRRSEEHDTEQSLALNVPTAFVVSASSVGGLAVAPLAEALHHLSAVSPGDAYNFFEEHFDQALDEDRFSSCEALLEATRDSLNRGADSASREALDKVLVRETRLMRRTQRAPRAQEMLKQLLEREAPPVAPPFRRQLLGDLGVVYLELENATDALGRFAEALRLAEQPDASPVDRATARFSLAITAWTVGEYDRALDEFRESIQLANGAALGVDALANSSGVLSNQGRWRESWTMALEALHLARTEHRRNAPVAEVVARRLLSLVGSRSPALIDTLYAEAKILSSPQTVRATLDLRKEYVEALQDGGQLARATKNLRGLTREARRHPDPRFSTQLLLLTSLMRIDERRLEEGIDICSEVLRRVREGKGTSGDQALAQINRATTNVERIRAGTVAGDAVAQHWKYVRQDAQEAAQLFERLRYRRLAALARAYLELASASDRAEETTHAWDAIKGDLIGAPQYLAHYHTIRGDIEAQHDRWGAARELHRRASELHDMVDRRADAAQSLQLCAVMAERGRDYTEATRLRDEVARRRWELAEIDRYQPSAAAVAADEKNAEGLLHMYKGEAEDADNLRRARACFSAACSEATTVRWYYSLNLAYTCAALDDWGAAAQALGAALASGLDWWRAPRLEDLVREFKRQELDSIVTQAVRDFRERRIEEAAATFERAAASVAGSGQDEARLADIRAHLALVHLERNDLRSAIADTEHALVSYRRLHGAGAAQAFGRVCRSMIADVAQLRRLMSRLTTAEHMDTVDTSVRGELKTARLALVACLDEIYGLEPRPLVDTLPIVVPIVLELGDALIPKDTSTDHWVLFTGYIPQFAGRIQRDIGIARPAVHVRGNQRLSGGQYSVLINEIRAGSGETRAGMCYVPVGEDVARALSDFHHAVPAVHPGTGGGGFWLTPADAEATTHAGFPSTEPLAFIVEHLEAVVRAHLSEVVSLDEIDALVTSWIETHGGSASELPTPPIRFRLARVIRRLLDERVPLTQPEHILRVVHADAGGDVDELVRTIRTSVKRLLPGNEPTAHRELLPEEWERLLSTRLTPGVGRGADDISPQGINRVLVQIRRWLQTRHARTTIVVRCAELRPVVRRLIEPEFPDNHVLAQEEVVEQEAASVDVAPVHDERPVVN